MALKKSILMGLLMASMKTVGLSWRKALIMHRSAVYSMNPKKALKLN